MNKCHMLHWFVFGSLRQLLLIIIIVLIMADGTAEVYEEGVLFKVLLICLVSATAAVFLLMQSFNNQ